MKVINILNRSLRNKFNNDSSFLKSLNAEQFLKEQVLELSKDYMMQVKVILNRSI